jgi:hypothetical protein
MDQFVNYLQTIKISQLSVHQHLTGIKSYFLYNDIDIVNSKFKRRVTIPKSVLVLASSGVRAKEACAIWLRDLDFQYTLKQYNETKIVLISAYDLDNALVKELEENNHIANYIKKPIQIDDLIELVADTVN